MINGPDRVPPARLIPSCPTVDAVPVEDQPAPAGLPLAGEVVTSGAAPATPAVQVAPLEIPRDGVPRVVEDPAELAALLPRLAGGSGPVAVDAERASGHRYGQRAFLVQLRRAGASTALIDPVALPDLSAVSDVLAGTEWVIHAASQDLACLAEVGMTPRLLFDTELGGRLAGYQRVGLATMVERVPCRSSMISSKSLRSCSWVVPVPQSSMTRTSIRSKRASRRA